MRKGILGNPKSEMPVFQMGGGMSMPFRAGQIRRYAPTKKVFRGCRGEPACSPRLNLMALGGGMWGVILLYTAHGRIRFHSVIIGGQQSLPTLHKR